MNQAARRVVLLNDKEMKNQV